MREMMPAGDQVALASEWHPEPPTLPGRYMIRSEDDWQGQRDVTGPMIRNWPAGHSWRLVTAAEAT